MFNLKAASLAAAVVLVAGSAHAECDAAAAAEECKGMLDDGYSVMKTYELSGEEGKAFAIEDDNVMTSRMSYQVVLCGPAAEETEFMLETGSRTQVADNKSGDGLKTKVSIEPERMSVYYLIFNGPEDPEMCGAAVVGVKKK